ncbi:DUF397 domain-containing protein [Streptomyces sp. WMMC500]|uniref:DUF397 domain-containing protein n=1 Tax=Streptomyces sp. WMMC500 TaxID=3015154 RepID=UPI00248B33CB|nr:DUF397 domain-containing protein [Streptomyces sp. WMMC500]WBB59942.1 DUF397 domain-containing protein [Streptomyces sp. WMMC500]
MSTTPHSSGVRWIKSSYSNGDGGNCVEWAPGFAAAGIVPVRDSKDPDGPALTFTADAWTAFIADVKTGTYLVVH